MAEANTSIVKCFVNTDEKQNRSNRTVELNIRLNNLRTGVWKNSYVLIVLFILLSDAYMARVYISTFRSFVCACKHICIRNR